MQEKIIVSLTSYKPRLNNLPTVLDTIFQQTCTPDLVVLNLAYEEVLPPSVDTYLQEKHVEIQRVEDTKVYKKFIPTLQNYPNDLVICIDDDKLYPQDMIAEFMLTHKRFSDLPISGNHYIYGGVQCHCGRASLVSCRYFYPYLSNIDEDLMQHCPSSDLVYTYFAHKSGHPYIRTTKIFDSEMPTVNEGASYSESIVGEKGLETTWNYLISRFGSISVDVTKYINDEIVASLMQDMNRYNTDIQQAAVKSTIPYRIGNSIVKPLKELRKILQHQR